MVTSMAAFTFAVDSRLFGDPLKRMLSRPPWWMPPRPIEEAEGTGRVSTAKTFVYERQELVQASLKMCGHTQSLHSPGQNHTAKARGIPGVCRTKWPP